MAEIARHSLTQRSQLDLYRRIVTTSTTLRLPVFRDLSAHELRLAQQLQARHAHSGPPDLDTRLLVARSIAAYRVWLDLTLEGAPGAEGDEAAQRLFDRIFDADPIGPFPRSSAPISVPFTGRMSMTRRPSISPRS
jgi:hypothetical protein